MRGGFSLPGWRVTSPYGWRTHPISGTRRFHSGVDFGQNRGVTILAASSGEVVGKWYNPSKTNGYGHSLKAKNLDGSFSFYAHMDAASPLRVGDKVEVGRTVIGKVGSTGAATGPHLHFEIALDLAGTKTVDPVSYAAARPLQPITATKPPAKPRTHTVARGESLSGIAKKHKTTWQKLHQLNRSVIGSNPNRIFAGQVLRLPGATASAPSSKQYYSIGRGDSIWAMAQRRVGGSTANIQREVDRILKLNPTIKDPSKIAVGTKIRLR